jgi:hypothetical protein
VLYQLSYRVTGKCGWKRSAAGPCGPAAGAI